MSTIQATNLKSASSASNNIVLDASGNATFAGTAAMASSFLRNRIINGDMRIDQRNAGAAWGTSINGYTVDRWICHQATTTGKLNGGQNYNSITPPSGFRSYIGVQSQSSYSVGASDYYFLQQIIEGFNVADLMYGTASAVTTTLSFWVRSSLTGTFGVGFSTFDGVSSSRGYAQTYTINSANTWEYKTITIPGDTGGAGVWQTGNGIGLRVNFGLGVGSNFTQASGSWTSANIITATGATSVVGTNGATFYLTGVQLEVGTVATPFERRQYGQEFTLCQRYFERSDQLFQTASNGGLSNSYPTGIYYQVTKRAPATVTIYSGGSLLGTAGSATWYPGGVVGAVNPETNNTTGYMFSRVGISTYTLVLCSYTASSEL